MSAEVAKGRGSDDAIMLYTSGTTGRPKGAVLSYDNLVWAAKAGAAFDGLREGDELLSYLPMAWVGDHIFSYAQGYVVGLVVNCPESAATVMTDLREIGPTYYFAPPRVLENLITQVTIRMEDAGFLKRGLFQYFMGLARRVGPALLDGRPVGPIDRLLYALGNLLIYGPLKNTLGMSRVRVAYTAGEAVGPEIFNFYRALGVNMKQLYGQTEASVFVTIHPNGEVFPDTVGKPVSEVELRIAESGEVLYRSPGVFKEYFKNREATNDTKTADGWVHTGDAGYLDERGHLRIIDRAKDVGKLNDGTLFAPKFIENKLKFFPHINEAVAFGHGRDYVAVFVNIDMTAVGDWAERRNISYASYQELARASEVYDLVQGEIERVNRDLAADPRMAGAQIRRFLILHKALEADDGELTRTNKVRRSFIGERYKALVDALYSGVEERPHQGRRDLRGRPQGHDRGRHRDPRPRAPSRHRAPRAGSCARRAERDGRRARVPSTRCCSSVENISLSFGGVKALSDISFDIAKGEIRAIIGPNGAGKSSMLNCINGFYHPQQGAITYKGVRAQPDAAARGGRAGHRAAPSRTSRCSAACRRSTTS